MSHIHDDSSVNGRVTMDRSEYAAFKGLTELNEALTADNGRLHNRLHDLTVTCNAQARRLSHVDLVLQQHDRVHVLQQMFIDLLRDGRPGVMSFESLSEFWRRWCVSASSQPRDEVAKFEPDLFRTWRNFVNNSGRWSVAGTREEIVAKDVVTTPDTIHAGKEADYRAKVDELSAHVVRLEAEIAAYKKGR